MSSGLDLPAGRAAFFNHEAPQIQPTDHLDVVASGLPSEPRLIYIYIIDILYQKTTEITTIWQWRTKKRNVKFYLQIRYSQAMYSNNTFFLFYLLLFVTSKRKIQLDPSNFIITFSPTCTKSSVYPKITSSSSPLRSRRPPPSRYARAVRE